jgi:hypothetical protein
MPQKRKKIKLVEFATLSDSRARPLEMETKEQEIQRTGPGTR